MAALSQLMALMGRELRTEWKQKYALSGLLVYAFTMVFIIGFSFREGLSTPQWNIIFWIVLLFVAVNAVARSFMADTRGQSLYLYTLAPPGLIMLAKLIFSVLLLAGLALLTLLFFLFFAHRAPSFEADTLVEQQARMGQFAVITLLGAAGFAANLTLVSAIASRARNAATLVAVLGFPLMIPELIACITAGQSALSGHDWAHSSGEMFFSAGYFGLMVCISLILFPFVWKD